jgi:hypothetical protein
MKELQKVVLTSPASEKAQKNKSLKAARTLTVSERVQKKASLKVAHTLLVFVMASTMMASLIMAPWKWMVERKSMAFGKE